MMEKEAAGCSAESSDVGNALFQLNIEVCELNRI
jgi:hypothetical protein